MKTANTDQLVRQAFARLDATALGIAVGTLCGVGLFGATIVLLLKGGEHVGQNLRLLAQFFPGYRVTWRGAFVGLAYGCVAGFIAGWVLAQARNLAVRLFLWIARARAAAAAARSFFDNV